MSTKPLASTAAHWEEYWRDGSSGGEILGGEGGSRSLDAFWRRFLGERDFAPPDLALDVASGAAPIARLALAEFPAERRPRFICADYAPAALASARRMLGAAIEGVACDARALPFRELSFSGVVSQFGLEYVGNDGFSAAARMVARGGRLAAIIHYRGGAIETECAENARVVGLIAGAGLIASARKALRKTYEGPKGGGVHAKSEKAFAAALDDANAALMRSPASTGRGLSLRYAGDIAQLAARRFAFAPEDAYEWLKGVEARLDAYSKRMTSMVAAARSSADMTDIKLRLESDGLEAISFAPLTFRPGDPPGAWTLEARRPA